MTREEAWNRIDAIIEKYEVDDVYVTINNHKDYDALRFVRKLLEQEPVLDKIRAEIVQIPTISFNANDIYKADVLQIIDKYRKSEEV